MRAFTSSRVFTVFVALFFLAAGNEILAQGKGKGRDGDNDRGSQKANRGDRGGGNREHARQDRVHQAPTRQQGVQQEQAQQQRLQQIQQQRQQQAHHQVPQNRENDRRVQMQQVQQQRQQQEQQRFEQNRGNDRRVQMQPERMQQIQQQRQIQAQQRVQQNQGSDRRAQMQQAQQQRMQQIQQQRQQQAQQRVVKNRGSDGPVQMQHQRPLPAWAGRNGGEDRVARRRGRQSNAQPEIIPEQKVGNWFPLTAENRADGRGFRRSEDRRERLRNRDSSLGRQSPAFSGVWPKNYGQQRRAEVLQRNAERRALRQNRSWGDSAPTYIWQQRAYIPTYRPRTFYEGYVTGYTDPYSYRQGRRINPGYTYDRSIPNYGGSSYGYVDNGYSDPYYAYDYDGRPSAADIFRTVIFAVLGGGNPATNDYAYYDGKYDSDQYAAYSPQYSGYEGGGYYPAGYSYATDPAYYDPYFYQDPQYAEVLPIQHFARDMPGGGLFRQLFTHLLAIGYDQGFQDGVAAKSIRERDRVFSDPYAYDNAGYDPYSASLGDNRRCLGQGYELGYEDAINNIDGYNQFQDGGVDLVSVLIGSVSQLM